MIICDVGPLWGHFSTQRGPKGPFGGPRGPRRALEVLGGPQVAWFGPNCHKLVQLGGSHLYHVLWPLKRPLRHSWDPQKGLFGPLWVLKWPQSGPTSHIIMYCTGGDCFGATWTLLGCLGRHGSISASGAWEQIQKSQFGDPEKFLLNRVAHLFLTLLLTQKGTFCAILTNLKMVFLRKIHFFAYPIWAKNGLFLVPRAPFWPKTTKT